MKLAALLYVAAGCATSTDVDVITDDVGTASTAERIGEHGLQAIRLDHRGGLAVGFNNRRLGDGWSLAHPDVFDGDVARLAPGVLRFPGGTIAQYYDWDGATGAAPGTLYQRGSTCPSAPIDPSQLHWQPILPMTSVHERSADTLETLLAEKPATTKIDFVLNMLIRASWGEIKMLDVAAEKGLSIDRVELGNEFYYPGTSNDGTCDVFAAAFPTATAYATVANAWARRIVAGYPAAKIGIVANERFDDHACSGDHRDRFRCWNHDLLAAKLDPAISALVIHPYIWHAGTCASGRDMYDDADSLIGAAMQMARALFADARGSDRSRGLLSQSLAAWHGDIWVTEYGFFNYNDGAHDWKHTWAAGLGVLAYALRLTSDARISVLLHHNITDVMWAPGQVRSGLTARGIALGALDEAVRDARPTAANDVWKLDFTNTGAQYTVRGACGYDGSGSVSYHAVIGRWFTHDYDRNGVRGSGGIVVNLGASAVEIDLGGLYSEAGARADVWSAPADADVDDTLAPAMHHVIDLTTGSRRLQLPARAIVRFQDLAR